LKTEAELSRAISSLATRMRISQQSRMTEKKTRPITLKRPWEDQD
jgi:hypothetical protein